MQTGVAKGLKVPCLFMITEVSIGKGKVFPYSLPSVGPGADPGEYTPSKKPWRLVYAV